MAVKRGLIVGGAALAGLLALAGLAKAAGGSKAPSGGGGGGPAPDDLHSPEACASYRAALNTLQGHISSLVQAQTDIANAQIGAAQAGDDAMVAQLAAQLQGVNAALGDANARANRLQDLIAGCP